MIAAFVVVALAWFIAGLVVGSIIGQGIREADRRG